MDRERNLVCHFHEELGVVFGILRAIETPHRDRPDAVAAYNQRQSAYGSKAVAVGAFLRACYPLRFEVAPEHITLARERETGGAIVQLELPADRRVIVALVRPAVSYDAQAIVIGIVLGQG